MTFPPLPLQYLFARLFPPVSPRKRRREFKLLIRALRKIRNSRKNKTNQQVQNTDIHPIVLGRRVVLRGQVRVPVKIFSALHRLYKDDSLRANKLLANVSDGDPTERENVLMRLAIQSTWEERLKTTGQLAGIFPPDPDVDLATQELLEQFYGSHEMPNDAEKVLLEQAGRVNVDTIDDWFAAKHFRLLHSRAARTIWPNPFRSPHFRKYLLQKLKNWKVNKPLSRH